MVKPSNAAQYFFTMSDNFFAISEKNSYSHSVNSEIMCLSEIHNYLSLLDIFLSNHVLQFMTARKYVSKCLQACSYLNVLTKAFRKLDK